jgi:hypothetical protein
MNCKSIPSRPMRRTTTSPRGVCQSVSCCQLHGTVSASHSQKTLHTLNCTIRCLAMQVKADRHGQEMSDAELQEHTIKKANMRHACLYDTAPYARCFDQLMHGLKGFAFVICRSRSFISRVGTSHQRPLWRNMSRRGEGPKCKQPGVPGSCTLMGAAGDRLSRRAWSVRRYRYTS